MRPEVLAESLALSVKGLLEPIVAALERERATVAVLLTKVAALEARAPEPGPPGPPGPAGPPGADGKDGKPGMEYLGVYVSGKAYDKGDTVTVGGSMWTCLRPTEGSPGMTRDWQLSVQHGKDLRDPKGRP